VASPADQTCWFERGCHVLIENIDIGGPAMVRSAAKAEETCGADRRVTVPAGAGRLKDGVLTDEICLVGGGVQPHQPV
jgi:hypothetical protein